MALTSSCAGTCRSSRRASRISGTMRSRAESERHAVWFASHSRSGRSSLGNCGLSTGILFALLIESPLAEGDGQKHRDQADPDRGRAGDRLRRAKGAPFGVLKPCHDRPADGRGKVPPIDGPMGSALLGDRIEEYPEDLPDVLRRLERSEDGRERGRLYAKRLRNPLLFGGSGGSIGVASGSGSGFGSTLIGVAFNAVSSSFKAWSNANNSRFWASD
jgi:hypothetical protein